MKLALNATYKLRGDRKAHTVDLVFDDSALANLVESKLLTTHRREVTDLGLHKATLFDAESSQTYLPSKPDAP